MKHALVTFLIGLLLAPSLVCAMAACPYVDTTFDKTIDSKADTNVDKSLNAHMANEGMMPTCHEAMKTKPAAEPSAPQIPMLVLDCLGLDIFHQIQSLADTNIENGSGDQPGDPTLSKIVFQGFIQISVFTPQPAAPPGAQLRKTSSHPLYFSTQRIRI